MASDPHWNKVVLALKCDGTNGSTTFTDSSISAKAVTANGNAQISTAQSKFPGGASAYFDGAGDYLSVAESSDFGFGTGDFTIECFVKTTATNKSVWDNRSTAEPGAGYIAATTGKIGFWNNTSSFEGTSNTADGAWHHLAWCRANGTLRLFVDGVAEYTGAMSSDLGASRPMRIGRDYLNAGDFNGYIDDLRITKGVARYTANFTPPAVPFPNQLPVISGVVKDSSGNFAQRLVRALDRKTCALLNSGLSNASTGAYSLPVATADEVIVMAHDTADADPYWSSVVLAMHMNGSNNSTYFKDEIGKTVTPSGDAKISTAQSKFGGASAYFDGTGDYLSVPNSTDFDFGSGDFTVEFWLFTPISWSSQASSSAICGKKKNDASNGWVIYRDGGQPTKLDFRFSQQNNLFSASVPTQNVWEHWAVTRSSGTLRVFKDGVLDASTTNTSTISDGSAEFKVGLADAWAGSYLNAYIDDLRITKGVARYTANFTAPTSAFVGGIEGGTNNAIIYDRVIPS